MILKFTDLKFGDKWASEMNLVAVSTPDRYSSSLTPIFSDQTLNVNGKDGTYYWGTNKQSKSWNVNFAFNNITDSQLKKIVKWLDPKKIDKLIFNQEPFRYCVAKVADAPQFTYVPFETEVTENEITINRTVYKGELVVNFISFSTNSFAVDNYYENIDIGPNSEKSTGINGWTERSCLLGYSGDEQYETKNIKIGNSTLDTINTTDTLYIVNSGDIDAPLTVSFSLTNDISVNSPLELRIFKYDYGQQTLDATAYSIIKIKQFSTYKPFSKLFVGDNAVWSRWTIVVDSSSAELYIINKIDSSLIVNLGLYNVDQEFLNLAPIENVNYFKAFNTIITTPNDSALEEAILNKFETSMNIADVSFEYKHRYM